MESAQNLINESIKEAKIADYIFQVTSKLIADKKIIISALMHLKKSILLSMKSYQSYEKESKKSKNYFSTDELIYNNFMDSHAGKFLNNDSKKAIEKIIASNKSYDHRGMILEKNSKYSFLSESYELIMISPDEIRSFSRMVLDFAKKIEEKIKSQGRE